MLEWTPEVIRFRMDAARVNRFERLLAARIAPYLPPHARICDAGCGLGDLSLALAECGFCVTAVDTDERALAHLRRRVEGSTVEPLCADVLSAQCETPYDAMVFCFFGATAETVEAIRRQCSGKAFLIKRDSAAQRFGTKKRPPHRFSVEQTCAELDALGVSYRLERFTAEMGQPFRNLSEAIRFFALYDGGIAPTAEEAAARLIRTDYDEFPLYYPVQANLGMFILENEGKGLYL